MITADDTDFHDCDPREWRWAETQPIIFSVPEARILGNLYVTTRPNLGVALSTVGIAQGMCLTSQEMEFSDAQMHLPCPDSFRKFDLENGLSMEVLDAPRTYRMTYAYKGGDECSADLTFRGLHEPYDCMDPDQNPLLAEEHGKSFDARLGDQWGNSGIGGDFPNGHYEMIGHITGELILRGKRYEVSCFEGNDHTWSRRTEVSRRAVCFLTAAFGEDYGIHLAVPMDIVNGDTVYEKLRFGYVLEDGEVYGLVDARVEGTTTGMLPTGAAVEATDVRGKVHRFTGYAVAGHPFDNFNPSHICFQSLMRWECNGRVGHSEMGNIFGREFLHSRLSKHARG